MATELNAVLRTKDNVLTGHDATATSNTLQVVVGAPGAGNRLVVTGIRLAATTGTGAAEALTVTGGSVVFQVPFTIGGDVEVLMEIAADAQNQGLTIAAAATNLTGGLLTTTWRVQRED